MQSQHFILLISFLFFSTEVFSRENIYVEVKDGAYLNEISFVLYGDHSKVNDIARWNNISNTNKIMSGQKLKLKIHPYLTPIGGHILLMKKRAKKTRIKIDDLSYNSLKELSVKNFILKYYGVNFNNHKEQTSLEFLKKEKRNSKELVSKNRKAIIVGDKAMTLPAGEMSFAKPLSSRDPSSIRQNSKKISRDKNYFFTSLGYTQRVYREGLSTALNLSEATAKFSYRRLLLEPSLHFDFDARTTLTPLSSTSKNQARFYEGDLRLGYSLPFFSEPWRFTLYGGLYYSTMAVESNRFGYSSRLTYQLYPSLRYLLGNGQMLGGAIKFVPTDVSSLSNNRVLGLELDWTFIFHGNPLRAELDLTDTKFTNSGISFSSFSTLLSLGFGF